MKTLILYHGTSAKNAKQIEKYGFVSDKEYNWKVKSKKGFVYLSLAYAPFYAMMTNSRKLALIKVEVKLTDCYPEDDFLMAALGKTKYSQKELDKIDLEIYKKYWKNSLESLGNIAVKPSDVKILGFRYFNEECLAQKCDPVICPINFQLLGRYYEQLTEWIYNGKSILEFKNMFEFI